MKIQKKKQDNIIKAIAFAKLLVNSIQKFSGNTIFIQ